jgi:asparagine synthase (glutamine-hydrolysing)
MAQAMAHRGPDDQHTWSDGVCGLSFRRLAIIDIDPRSSQPQSLGPLRLIFNGEIYNYRELRDELQTLGHSFTTEGDAEVLLHAWSQWGEGALDRVNAMFALAVWDEEERSLTLASDPFGEKPLYYVERDGGLVFGSDIRAVMCATPLGGADLEAAGAFVARGLVPSPGASFFANVKRLPGAHLLRWKDGRSQVRRYWAPQPVDAPADYEDAVALLRELLLDSIRIRLRSDVPVATSLSGGIDSAAVVALSAELAGDHRRHAFTASFPGFERDEWAYAQASAEAAGVVQHHRVEPTADGLLADLETIVRDQEEPFGSTAIYAQWCVFKAAREAGVVVLLDGQGADELFGGYEDLVLKAMRARGARGVQQGLAAHGPERDWLASVASSSAVGRSALKALGRRVGSPYATDVSHKSAAQSQSVQGDFKGNGDVLRNELLTETFVTSLPPLLRYADRDSMAHSREVRLPFLDRRIAELAFSVPGEFLYRNGVTKSILRDAVRGSVPQVILDRRDKVAFQPPQTRWLSEPAWVERIADVLLDPGAAGADLYDRAPIEADARSGHWRDPAALWRALSVELWLQAFAEPQPSP